MKQLKVGGSRYHGTGFRFSLWSLFFSMSESNSAIFKVRITFKMMPQKWQIDKFTKAHKQPHYFIPHFLQGTFLNFWIVILYGIIMTMKLQCKNIIPYSLTVKVRSQVWSADYDITIRRQESHILRRVVVNVLIFSIYSLSYRPTQVLFSLYMTISISLGSNC